MRQPLSLSRLGARRRCLLAPDHAAAATERTAVVAKLASGGLRSTGGPPVVWPLNTTPPRWVLLRTTATLSTHLPLSEIGEREIPAAETTKESRRRFQRRKLDSSHHWQHNNHQDDGQDKQEDWQQCWDSTQWLLHETQSWNVSRLHWREARRLTEFWLQQKHDKHDEAAAAGSSCRTVLQLLERAIEEQERDTTEVEQQQESSERGARLVKDRDNNNDNFVGRLASKLFWDDPRVVAIRLTDLWRREVRQQKQIGHVVTSEESPVSPRDGNLEQGEGAAAAGPPSREEMKAWIREHGARLLLPASSSSFTVTTWLDSLSSPHSTPNAAALRLLAKLERSSSSSLDGGGFATIHEVHGALANLDAARLASHTVFLEILQLLKDSNHLQPNHETHLLIMEGVVAARQQRNGQTLAGTGRLLFDLFWDLWQHDIAAAAAKEDTLFLRKAHWELLLETLLQEGGSSADMVWKLWEQNEQLRATDQRHMRFTGDLTQPMMVILSRSGSNRSANREELPSKARAIGSRMQEWAQDFVQQQEAKQVAPTNSKDKSSLKVNRYLPPSRQFWIAYLQCLVCTGKEVDLEEGEQLLLADDDTAPMRMRTQKGDEGDFEPILQGRLVESDAKMVGILLRAWAHAQQPSRAQALFLETVMRQPEPTRSVDAKTLLDVVQAWTDCETLSAPEKGEALSELWTQVADLVVVDDASTLPLQLLKMLSSTVNGALDAQRAEIIFKSLLVHDEQQRMKNHSRSVLTVGDYCAVIAALSRSPQAVNGPQRAESILMELVRRADAGEEQEPIPEQAFTSTIACWGRSKQPNAAVQAQNVFDLLLHRRRQAGENPLYPQPSNKVYSALMQAWARAGKPKRVESILNQMLTDYRENGNDLAKPDVIAFNTVLSAWERFSRDPENRPSSTTKLPSNSTMSVSVPAENAESAVETHDRAHSILQLMLEVHKSQTLPVLPNATSYGSVIATLVHSRKPQRADLARSYLAETWQHYEAGHGGDCRPNAYLYGALIQVLARVLDETATTRESKREIALEMEQYLGQMLSLTPIDHRQVERATLAAVKAWSKVAPIAGAEAVDHAEALVQQWEDTLARSRPRDENSDIPAQWIWVKLFETYRNAGPALSGEERKRRVDAVREKLRRQAIDIDDEMELLLDSLVSA